VTADVAVEVSGPDGAPPLVLLHSLGGSSAVWDAALGALSEQFRVVRIDTRGHGCSRAAAPSTTPVSIDVLADDVLAALDRLGLTRVDLAGISVGGMVGMWLAIHEPQRIGRLAVLSSSAHPGGADAWRQRAATVRKAGMDEIADSVVARWLTPELAQRDPRLAARLREILTTTDAERYAQYCDALAVLDLRADLGRIAAPTLVIAGDRDLALPVEHSRVIADGVAGARLAVVAGAAHVSTLEQPGPITQLLLEHFGAGAALDTGLRTRRAVLGNAHVDRAIAATTEFTADFQEFITRYAWGEIWTRPGLSRRDRSIATLAALVALGAEHEIAMHVRAALGNGLSAAEIGETLLHTAVYAGLPRANRAFAIASAVVAEAKPPPPD
jgi:3-oxoadipate enol-lactonase/4-carboxymuconolactone decarboxylase